MTPKKTLLHDRLLTYGGKHKSYAQFMTELPYDTACMHLMFDGVRGRVPAQPAPWSFMLQNPQNLIRTLLEEHCVLAQGPLIPSNALSKADSRRPRTRCPSCCCSSNLDASCCLHCELAGASVAPLMSATRTICSVCSPGSCSCLQCCRSSRAGAGRARDGRELARHARTQA